MPTKIATETQILRKLANTPLQIEITLLKTATYNARHAAQGHLETFYKTFDEVRDMRFDGLIITGAPVELMDFEQVDYWDELVQIMEWSRTNVHSTLHICWGAQAGIYYKYGIDKHVLPNKVFGVFKHKVLKPTSPLVRGFDDEFWAPHSRFTEVSASDIEQNPALEIIATSDEAGVYIAKSTDSRDFFVFGHPEYDRHTLGSEYARDVDAGKDIAAPAHYYESGIYRQNDNTAESELGGTEACAVNPLAANSGEGSPAELADVTFPIPNSNWRAHASLLYTNWLNYYVYQTTPYDLRDIR
jgi:homoserine O-succinyltransferase